jgi:ligand-binding sensor domain-containing protein/anti-sigma regulatory factor (Ser/Thr protein kinase)
MNEAMVLNSIQLKLFLQTVKLVSAMLFYLLCLCYQTVAQPGSHYRLSVFGTRNGLLSPKIYTLTQTSDNHLWIGTEIGASRYNGYEFQNLQYTAAQEQIGKVVAITQDSVGGVWLGGEGGLFYFFDGEIHRCSFVQQYAAAVESLVTDVNGNVFIGEMHGLYRLTPDEIKQWRIKKQKLQLSQFYQIKERIICLDADRKGNIYFGSFDGVFTINVASATVQLIWKNKTPNNLVRFITATSPDSLFFNQYEGESTSLVNGALKNYTAKNYTGHSFFKKDNKVFRLTTSTVERFENNDFIPFITFGETNYAFDGVCDEEGNIWVGTWEGLFKYRYNPFSVFRRKETTHPETFSLLETKDGKLLFGGNRGLVHYKNGADIIPYNIFKPVFPAAEVLAMYEHDDGCFWFGSGYQGITRVKNGVYTNYNENNGLADNHCNTFYRVNEHAVYGCSEKGVVVIDPLAENPITGNYNFAKAYNRQPKLLGVLQPAANEFLFYSNLGLFRLKENKLHNESIKGMPAENLYITRMQKDKHGKIWIATQGKGLLQCNYQKGDLILQKQFTKKDGLLSDEVLSLLIDRNDNLWVADYTSLSLLKDDGGNSFFVNFNEQDGLPEDYYQYLHLAQQADGRIWALNSMNLFSFHPDSVLLNDVPPKLFFNNISLEKSGAKTLSANNIGEFAYNENSFSLSFTAVSLSNPYKIKYVYRLMPGDTTWIETSERKIYFNSLNPGTYRVEIKASNNSGVWSVPLQYSFEIKPPFWNSWWFYVLLAAVALAFIYWLFRRRIMSVKVKAAIQQQLTELESKALRAQMNPHFIFNSLNAIQELIVTENVTAAYDYLSKFSKLLRLVLNNSEKSLIPLADEITMLQLYLELESLRFRKSFTYKIDVANSLDAESMLVPPLLLQPFIENAVWHGLMLKEGEKNLSLHIRQQSGEILCVVEDNGIGRKKSAEIKAQKLGAVHLESKGLKLSQHRISLLQLNGKKGSVKIEDLYENNEATGTRVSIQLPLTQG